MCRVPLFNYLEFVMRRNDNKYNSFELFVCFTFSFGFGAAVGVSTLLLFNL